MASPYHSELVLGGARSGKSLHALTRARRSAGPVVFLATAHAGDAEMRARIARHRAERSPDITTIEEPLDVASACRRLAGRYELALIDCLTLWISNRVLRGDADDAIFAAADDLAEVIVEARLGLVIVSNEVGQGVHPATDLGLRFRDVLGAVNQKIAAVSDTVTLMVAGIAVAIKEPGRSATIPRIRPSEHDGAFRTA